MTLVDSSILADFRDFEYVARPAVEDSVFDQTISIGQVSSVLSSGWTAVMNFERKSIALVSRLDKNSFFCLRMPSSAAVFRGVFGFVGECS